MSMMEEQRRSPYLGLVPYDEKDTAFFFGREKETRLITANLFAAPLTLLYGASGVGKSSVLRAGVIPNLRQRDTIAVMFNTWQSDEVNRLRSAVLTTCPEVSISPSASLSECLIACAVQMDRQLIVIFDQFEEYFLYHPQDQKEDSFVAQFSRAVTEPGVPMSFLISIREDSLAKLDRFEGYIPTLFDNYLRLEHLDRHAATDAVVKPIERYNQQIAEARNQYSVEPELVDTVINQVKTGRIIIGELGRGQAAPRLNSGQTTTDGVRIEAPYLQLVLTRLWDEEIKRNSRVLRLATLKTLGGADQIIRSHLDAKMKNLKPDQQEVAAYALHYLVTPSGTKIALSAEDLSHFSNIPIQRIETTINRLAAPDLRILSPVTAEGGEITETWYEIFHDALAPAILDWRTRYFKRQTFLEKVTLPSFIFVLIAIWIQAQSYSKPLNWFLRGSSLIILNTIVVLQVYKWFYQQVRPKITKLNLAGFGGADMGILLGILLPILWYVMTEDPLMPNPNTPMDLGAITFFQYLKYLFTLVLTMVAALLSFFVVVQGTAQLTERHFKKRFDLGFYGAYFALCTLIIALIILALLGIIPKWIAFG